MDDLSIKLNWSGIGGDIGGHLINHLFYANGLIRLSSAGLLKLVDMCSIYLCNRACIKGECSVFKTIFLLWMKTIHYPSTIRSHLVTIAPMAPFTPKSTLKLRSVLHFRHSIVIPRFILRANTAQS